MNNAHQATNHNDGIDLLELCITLWQNKWTIISITLICTIIALIVAFVLIKPTYQSTMTISPPKTELISNLNPYLIFQPKGNLTINLTPDQTLLAPNKNYNISIMTPNDIFALFLRALQMAGIASTEIKNTEQYTLSSTSSNAQTSQLLLVDRIEEAQKEAQMLVYNQKSNTLLQQQQNISNALTILKHSLDLEYANNLQSLKNALTIAQDLNIITPMNIMSEPYMQGTKALSAQIYFLEKQKNNYAHDAQYRELLSTLEFLQTIKLPKPQDITVFTIDSEAFIPENPIKPNKKLIILIGFFLGGILGILIVLIRQAIRTRLSIHKFSTH